LIFKNQFITKGFTSTQFKTPAFWGIFSKKKSPFRAKLFFSFWQNVTPKKMASQESGEVFFKGIFLM
jgi:hypothetical protein